MDLPFAVPDPPPPAQTVALPTSDASTSNQSVSSSTNHPAHSSVSQRVPAHPPIMQSPLQQNGGLLYNNLIPGHYRYGVKPPPPPPGPLSVESSISSQQMQSFAANGSTQLRNNTNNSYSNLTNYRSTNQSVKPSTQLLQVSEPDEEDDDLLVVALDEEDDDDEKLYRPFRHSSNDSFDTNCSGGSVSTSNQSKVSVSKNKVQSKQTNIPVNTQPIDLLTVLLGGPAHSNSGSNQSNSSNISILIEEATTKSRKARAMTVALATKRDDTEKKNHADADNDLYVATANAHTEAALSFQRVYRSLLGMDNTGNSSASLNITNQQSATNGLSPSEELAKSMLILASGHARMATSLKNMGVKWNMGKAESFGIAMANNKTAARASGHSKTQMLPASSSNNTGNNQNLPQHERLRMAVRGALDTANHEEDITNSTFLARSTFGKPMVQVKANNVKSGGKSVNVQVFNEQNPVDDLMKLEKELKGMDMALEVGTSVSSLGAAVSSRPDGSFCVVPPGSSYMSSSFMWTPGIMGKIGTGSPQLGQQQNKHNVGLTTAGVRSRANHLQNFLGGGRPPTNPQPAPAPVAAAPMPSNQKADQPANNAGLDQSWWGGGQGSMMASVALSTVTASHQKVVPQPSSNSTNPRAESANTKQLMQLMDALKRLGDENAQLMREVEEAKAARSEAVAAKNMMEQFKKEYSQRFNKVKEALEKYPKNGPDNPVNNSSYMKSASTMELKKRDEIIKKLAADLRKEREETKKKDVALRKYEGFYREVKARSAEKARQRQLQEEQNKTQQQQQG